MSTEVQIKAFSRLVDDLAAAIEKASGEDFGLLIKSNGTWGPSLCGPFSKASRKFGSVALLTHCQPPRTSRFPCERRAPNRAVRFSRRYRRCCFLGRRSGFGCESPIWDWVQGPANEGISDDTRPEWPGLQFTHRYREHLFVFWFVDSGLGSHTARRSTPSLKPEADIFKERQSVPVWCRGWAVVVRRRRKFG